MEFYSEIKSVPLRAFPLTDHYEDTLTPRELTRLVGAFNAQFGSAYGLFVQFAIANQDRGKYHLWAIKNTNHDWSPRVREDFKEKSDYHTKLSQEDVWKMRSFIAGFTHGLRAFSSKKREVHVTTRRY